MKKREIETYMDAFMEGFWSCYCTMIDLIEDDEPDQPSQEIVEKSSETKRDLSETKDAPEVETSANSSKPKPRTGTNVPEPKNVPHVPERPAHDAFVELFKQGKLPTEVAKELNVSPQTAYNHLYKAKQAGELK